MKSLWGVFPRKTFLQAGFLTFLIFGSLLPYSKQIIPQLFRGKKSRARSLLAHYLHGIILITNTLSTEKSIKVELTRYTRTHIRPIKQAACFTLKNECVRGENQNLGTAREQYCVYTSFRHRLSPEAVLPLQEADLASVAPAAAAVFAKRYLHSKSKTHEFWEVSVNSLPWGKLLFSLIKKKKTCEFWVFLVHSSSFAIAAPLNSCFSRLLRSRICSS